MDDKTREKWYRIALWQTRGIGNIRYKKILEEFKLATNLFEAQELEIEEILPPSIVKAVNQTIATANPLDTQKQFERSNISVLVKGLDPQFPQLLTLLDQSPPILYVKGALLPEDENALAVVGTRKPTRYGLEVTRLFAGELARQGVTIVSGLAYGIDAQAHQSALDNGGRTIAVLAHGLDRVYPTGNEQLAKKILQNGALISAFPPGEPPSRGHFVARDEWIAMMSQGVLVTEGAVGSGALITAAGAQKFGRPVFAVPGPITSAMNHAPTQLLKSGAKLVSNSQDILSEFGLKTTPKKQVASRKVALDNELQQRIYAKLQEEPQSGDELSRFLDVSIFKLASELTLMELAGLIAQDGDQWRVA